MTIRRTPSDFLVRERLTDRFLRAMRPESGTGARLAVYELHKTSLTTPEATQRFAKAIGIASGAVEHAGLKDKHAQTSQHVTASTKSGELAAEASGQNWSAKRTGFSPEPIRAADIERNLFTIVVRDISDAAAREMHRRAHLLALPRTGDSRSLLIANYFGDQRFGSARHGEGWVAKHLIKGEFEQAIRLAIGTPARKDSGKKRDFTRVCATHWGKWAILCKELPHSPDRAPIEALAMGKSFKDAFTTLPYFTQQICVEAFQSHMWNDTARRLIERTASERSAAPKLIRTNDPFGEMIFPCEADDALRTLNLPMLAPESTLVDPWKQDAVATLAAEGIGLGDLQIPGIRRPAFGGADRSLFVEAEGFTITPPALDELSGGKRVKVALDFALPRGAYATVVLRALGQ